MALLFKNIEVGSKDLKKGKALVKNPKWKEGSDVQKYILEDGATYVRDGEFWQVTKLEMEDGSYMVPIFQSDAKPEVKA